MHAGLNNAYYSEQCMLYYVHNKLTMLIQYLFSCQNCYKCKNNHMGCSDVSLWHYIDQFSSNHINIMCTCMCSSVGLKHS